MSYMGQRAQCHGRAPILPRRTRLGATVESVLICTPDEAEQVWPSAEAILSTRTIEQLTPEEMRSLLSAFINNRTLAYQCLRWARWMTVRRHLVVRCVECRHRAWSDSVVSQQRRDGTIYTDEGKWRWVCPSQRVGTSGCGRNFYDTSRTPFSQSRVAPGLVFAALAYPSGVIERLVERGRPSLDLRRLRRLLHGLQMMEDRRLRDRLRQYARLFCGTVLLRDCPGMTRSFHGVQELEARLQSLHGSWLLAEENDTSVVRQRQASYAQVRKLLRDLQYVDKDSPRGRATQTSAYRRELWQELQRTIQSLGNPIHIVPRDLPALLDESPLPITRGTR